MEANIGDQVIVQGSKVGVPPRTGKIVEIIHHAGGDHYRVLWDDEHESIFFPSSDTRIEHTGYPQ